MRSAGRPISPTLHPRTRPEATDNATKMRATGDWFRHDGKNVEEAPPPAVRLQGYVAPDVAEKNKGQPDEWYEHNPKNPAPEKPQVRCPTEESKKYHDKIHGTEEHWYKMEDNKEYCSPRPKSRVTSVQGQECLDKLGKADTMDWYRHDHAKGDEPDSTPVKTRTGPLPYATENQEKLRPQHTQPDWYKNDGKPIPSDGEAVLRDRPAERVQTADAKEYLDRNRVGSSSEWYGHSSESTPQAFTPRPGSSKGMKASENWFSHDANKDFTPDKPEPHCKTESARQALEKSRGNEMNSILKGEGYSKRENKARVKPEAQDVASKSVQGMMAKYLDQDANAAYNSARAGGRAVKPEAEANMKKNQGLMTDSMQGHPMGGVREYSGKRVKAEGAGNVERNKGSMGSILGGGSPTGDTNRYPAPRIKSEASANAGRHQGQGMSEVMGGVGHMTVSSGGSPAPRLQTSSARASAQKNQGTVGDLLRMQ